MIKEKVSVFLPTRAGSERVENKNTKTFSGVTGGLLAIKLKQLLDLSEVDEVVLSTNDEASIQVAMHYRSNEKLKVIRRPEELAQSSTNLIDLVKYVPTICNNDHILWTHVTSPLVKAKDYQEAIYQYFKELNNGYDSLMSVKSIQNFIWSSKDNIVVNKQKGDFRKWPRTQDLDPIYEVNSALFIASKNIYISEIDRIGIKPYLLKHNSLQSIDVDWEDDFKIAELVYNGFK